jgi:hypothetical protein
MSDYAALAQRVTASGRGIRGCLILSRDGAVLGADPEGDLEQQVKAAWIRFAAVGEPDRSYVEFPDQTWAYARRGGYAAFAVAGAEVRPGVVVDLLDQMLLAGEVERIHERQAMRLPEAPIAPSGKPRTILHRPERAPAAQPEPTPELRVEDDAPDVGDAPVPVGPEERPPEGQDEGTPEVPRPVEESDPEEEVEVDRILLAKEFAGLLQVPGDDDEAST